MNRIRFVFSSFKTVSLIIVFLVLGSNAMAENKDCWVDFFEGTQYTGKHFQLEGPAQLENLSNINGENWALRISSMKIGPKATVTVYENLNFTLKATQAPPDLMRSWGITEKDVKEDSELIFNANAKIHDLSDFNFSQKIKSLEIKCS